MHCKFASFCCTTWWNTGNRVKWFCCLKCIVSWSHKVSLQDQSFESTMRTSRPANISWDSYWIGIFYCGVSRKLNEFFLNCRLNIYKMVWTKQDSHDSISILNFKQNPKLVENDLFPALKYSCVKKLKSIKLPKNCLSTAANDYNSS